jgi:phosphatidylserine/phosphatidylglycerophosphate/cardiolipin synthase-like enzyme
LLVDGPVFFARMLDAIGNARSYVFLELYLVQSGGVANRFIEALVAAAQRGVMVKVLLDDFGALGLRAEDRERLRTSGIVLAFYNRLTWRKRMRNLLRDHRKLLLIDGEVAFVGGAGMTDEFDPITRPGDRWRDTMLEIHGPVIGDWYTLFVSAWHRAGLDQISIGAPQPVPAANGRRGRAVASSRLHRQQITRSVVVRIRSAERRIWIATAYFLPPRKLRRALVRAARRGIDVRLLVPGPRTDHPSIRYAGRRLYARLLRHGARILEYQPRFLHAKVILVDDWASIGSSNLDRWNLMWNLEANQEVLDAEFAESVAAMMRTDFADATEIQREAWMRRGWRARVLEAIGGAIDRWLRGLRR